MVDYILDWPGWLLSQIVNVNVSPDFSAFAFEFLRLIVVALVATRVAAHGLRKWKSSETELIAQLTVIMTYCLCWMYLIPLSGVTSLKKTMADSLLFFLALGICALFDAHKIMRQEQRVTWAKYREKNKKMLETV